MFRSWQADLPYDLPHKPTPTATGKLNLTVWMGKCEWACVSLRHHLTARVCVRMGTKGKNHQSGPDSQQTHGWCLLFTLRCKTSISWECGRWKWATTQSQLAVCAQSCGFCCVSVVPLVWNLICKQTGVTSLPPDWSWINHYNLCLNVVSNEEEEYQSCKAWSTYHLVAVNDEGLSQHKTTHSFRLALSPIQWPFFKKKKERKKKKPLIAKEMAIS